MNTRSSTPQDLFILSKEQLIDELIKSRAEAMFYYDFVEASLNLIWQCDLEGRYVYLNAAWEQAFGYKVEEMLGRKFSDFQRPEMAVRCEQEFARLIGGEAVKDFEAVHIGKAGNAIHLVCYARFMTDESGNITGIQGTAYDISGRKKSEAELEAYRRHLELLVDHRTAELASVNSSLVLEKRSLELANRNLKQMQTYMIQTEKMASLGRLSAGIAHEINNPIGYISTNLSVLRRYTDTIDDMFRFYGQLESAVKACSLAEVCKPLGLVEDFRREVDLAGLFVDLRKLIEESSRGVAQVARIVADLRTFAREEKAAQESADIHALIDATLNITRSNLKYNVEVVKEYGDLPRILCHPRQVEQVFINLLLNAAQAVGEKGRVVIRTSCQKDDVLIEIEDDGSGIPEPDLQHIFEPFFTTREVGQGTGLGLAIVYNIIEKHAGRIMVHSTVGKGTVVTINLPVGGKIQ